jgi:hypothetical protein
VSDEEGPSRGRTYAPPGLQTPGNAPTTTRLWDRDLAPTGGACMDGALVETLPWGSPIEYVSFHVATKTRHSHDHSPPLGASPVQLVTHSRLPGWPQMATCPAPPAGRRRDGGGPPRAGGRWWGGCSACGPSSSPTRGGGFGQDGRPRPMVFSLNWYSE